MIPRRGFTILEVLLALAVTALVMAALSPALTGALRAQRQARRAVDEAVAQRAALAQWRDDLLAALPPTGSVAEPFVLSQVSAGEATGSQLVLTVAQPAPFAPERVASRPDTGQAVITWSVAPATDGLGLAWTRARQTDLLATGTLPTPTAEVLLDHLASLSIQVVGDDGIPVTTYSSADHEDDLPTQVVLEWAFRREDGTAGPRRRLVLALPLGGATP